MKDEEDLADIIYNDLRAQNKKSKDNKFKLFIKVLFKTTLIFLILTIIAIFIKVIEFFAPMILWAFFIACMIILAIYVYIDEIDNEKE